MRTSFWIQRSIRSKGEEEGAALILYSMLHLHRADIPQELENILSIDLSMIHIVRAFSISFTSQKREVVVLSTIPSIETEFLKLKVTIEVAGPK